MKIHTTLFCAVALPLMAPLSCQPQNGADPLGDVPSYNPARVADGMGALHAGESNEVRRVIGLDVRTDL